MSSQWVGLMEGMLEKRDSLPEWPEPHIDPIAKQEAIEAAKEKLGQYFTPHAREAIEIALGTYVTKSEMTQSAEQRGEQ